MPRRNILTRYLALGIKEGASFFSLHASPGNVFSIASHRGGQESKAWSQWTALLRRGLQTSKAAWGKKKKPSLKGPQSSKKQSPSTPLRGETASPPTRTAQGNCSSLGTSGIPWSSLPHLSLCFGDCKELTYIPKGSHCPDVPNNRIHVIFNE